MARLARLVVPGLPHLSFAYDTNGYMVTIGGTTTYGRTLNYTSFNAPNCIESGAAICVAGATNSEAFEYDSEHRRMQQTTAAGTLLYINGGSVLTERYTDNIWSPVQPHPKITTTDGDPVSNTCAKLDGNIHRRCSRLDDATLKQRLTSIVEDMNQTSVIVLKRRQFLNAGCYFLAAIGTGISSHALADPRPPSEELLKEAALSPSEATQVALETACALATLVRPDGRFVYRYVDTVLHPLPGYDLVRHSGSVWAMNVAEKVGRLGEKIIPAARFAMSWLSQTAIRPGAQGGLCVAGRHDTAKLGASALALLAVATMSDFSQADAQLATELQTYIWSQAQPDGNFTHERDATTGDVEPFESEYYTGETLFALLTFAQKTGDKGGIDLTKDALLKLVSRDYGISEQSQWMMYATELCHKLSPSPALVAYAKKLLDNILADTGYRNKQLATPIATRTEAFVSYLRMGVPEPEAPDSRAHRAWKAIKENIEMQMESHLPGGAFCRGGGSREVRIDFLQHNLIALLGYGQLGIVE